MAKKSNFLKSLDIATVVLLIIGGLNWGLVGLFGFNLVSAIFGEMSALSRIVYILAGLSALYDIFMWRSIQRRWECRMWPAPSKGAAA